MAEPKHGDPRIDMAVDSALTSIEANLFTLGGELDHDKVINLDLAVLEHTYRVSCMLGDKKVQDRLEAAMGWRLRQSPIWRKEHESV